MYYNIVRDFWRQALIDFLLNHHKIDILLQIQEKANSAEPGESLRWAKIRENAINVSASIVIHDEEKLLAGWTLLSPTEPCQVRSKSYEEKVLLLTQKAIYICTFHYKLEKVVRFQRIELERITEIQRGVYILSTFDSASIDPFENYGFILSYTIQERMRLNSGCIQNEQLNPASNPLSLVFSSEASTSREVQQQESLEFSAFKMIRDNLFEQESGDTVLTTLENAEQTVDRITATIVEACQKVRNCLRVKEDAIISLEQAQKYTSLMARVRHRLKRVIWL
ncbi:uncharacterized protein VTP21DRAFT_8641 [Calcarisporiella thermophila]|uniref:uncharacterized protein n=1 Tax=Calcarisporiella thermophila TaxID=911321 RepID=UPI003742A499